jgi:hypothetical protein
MVYFKAAMLMSVLFLLAANIFAGTDGSAEAKEPKPPTVLMEADLPEGFPMPGRPGVVVDKMYPAYRAAAAEGDGAAFWTLFQHIQKHDIAMTAPVEMTLTADGEAGEGNDGETAAGLSMQRMLFMYASPDMGEAGQDGDVEVIDIPAMRVLSVGWFGGQGGEAARSARETLEQGLAERGDLEAAGPMRVLGYNSPSVPTERRYYEVQVPVEPADAERKRDPSREPPSEAPGE